MRENLDKSNKEENRSLSNDSIQNQGIEESPNFEDNTVEAVQMRQLQDGIDNSGEVTELRSFGESAEEHDRIELNKRDSPKEKNNTGIPNNIKEGIESLSGISLSDVKVHYNSDKPEKVSAHAYTEGTDVYIGPGQEEYLPHELWHVIQQKQGNVKPTTEVQGTNVNEDQGLEKEADVMGDKSLKTEVSEKTPVQLKKKGGAAVIQKATDTTVGGKVRGEQELIDIFDRLMGNAVFQAEVKQYVDSTQYLGLYFHGESSRFNQRRSDIFINDTLKGNTAQIREQLAFELHNATMTGTVTSMLTANGIPEDNQANVQKIESARITEYTEWLNLIRLGGKEEGGGMGFDRDITLVKNVKSHFTTFENYLHHQLSMGHTQHYLEGVTNTKGEALDLTNKDSGYYKTATPALFRVLTGEDTELNNVLAGLGIGSELEATVNWGRHGETTRTKGACNLRNDDGKKTVNERLSAGLVIKILDKNREGNYFSTAIIRWRKNHYWVQMPNGTEGWVEKSNIYEGQ